MIIDQKPPLNGVYLAHFGVKGMRWGRKKTPERLATDEHNRKVRQTFKNKKPTDKEILDARSRQEARAANYRKVEEKHDKNIDPETGKHVWTQEHGRALSKWQDSSDRYIGNRKTTGEKRTALLLGGPIGMYLASDFRTVTRLANQTTETPKQRRISRAKHLGKAATIAGLYGAMYVGVKQIKLR
jgi:hypothetical protein